MNTAETVEKTEVPSLPRADADMIIEAMSKLFSALETKYTLTDANVRGALSSMLYQLDR